jgi:urease accessory protein
MRHRCGRRCGFAALVTGAAILLPVRAEAHLVTTGLGPIYDGISHLFVSPADLLPVVAMSLLAGLNGVAAGRRALFVLTTAWLVGGLTGYACGSALVPGTATTASFLVLGGLTAADRRMPPAVITLLAMSIGFLHGWLNGAGLVEAQREPLGLVGIAAAIFVLVALLSSSVISLRQAWTRIAIRVAGSWVAAIGLLMLGWSLRGTP